MAEERFDEIDDFSPDLITLSDENGVEQDFEIIDALEYNDCTYLALMPAEDEDDEESEGQFVILRADIDEEQGEEFYATIEDEDELEAVLQKFNERLEDDEYKLEM